MKSEILPLRLLFACDGWAVAPRLCVLWSVIMECSERVNLFPRCRVFLVSHTGFKTMLQFLEDFAFFGILNQHQREAGRRQIRVSARRHFGWNSLA